MRLSDMKKIVLIFLFIFTQICFSFVSIDSEAPSFELTDTYDNKVSLESFRGKKVVLEWTNHGPKI